MLASDGDDDNYLIYGRSSPCFRGLQRSRPNGMDADQYYHTLQRPATEHITELALGVLILPPHLEWTTLASMHAPVCEYILDRRSPNISPVEFLAQRFWFIWVI